MTPTPITTLLVANRGEIARRVFRTAHRLGISTVAVCSDPDAGEPFAREADVTVPLPGSTAAETYLDAGRLLAAARLAGADAVHPGYGFLAEDPDFAQAVLDAGLAWVGPPPAAIRAMGGKVEAKRLVASAGVPLAPSAELDDDDAEQWLAAAEQVGYPLLVKASAGGGGKGMRLVTGPEPLAAEVAAARREAASAFGDPTVFLERYLAGARHVEVQVFGDTHGRVVHLFERECSIQRRHQKVVEESPSPGVTAATRERLYAAAVEAARAVGYVGAGTVEFLVDGAGDAQRAYFLEMNTRLQVEHPVTELVTGLDLVELQLAVAQGEPLPFGPEGATRAGHAIEVRLYAEDPAADHRPSTGPVLLFEPGGGEGVRWDSGVETGSVVSPYYDPMLGKAIALGATRAQASARLARALRGTRVHGPTTNRDALVAILESTAFRSGDTPTDFLDRHPDLLAARPPAPVRTAQVLAAVLHGAHTRRAAAAVQAFAPSGWRNVPAVPQTVVLDVDGEPVEVGYGYDRTGGVRATVGGESHEVRVVAVDAGLIDLVVDGVRRRLAVSRHGDRVFVDGGGWSAALAERPRFPDHSGATSAHGPSTPVPGTVTVVLVAAGDAVVEGQTLVVLEAMKMEHRIVAGAAGVVTEVLVAVGDSVDAHQVVAVLADTVLADTEPEGADDA